MNDIRIVGTIALAIMIVICAIGMEWETKAQNFLLAIIVAAIFNFVIGSIFGPSTPTQAAEGFIGFSSKILCDCLLNAFYFMIFFLEKNPTVLILYFQLKSFGPIGALTIDTAKNLIKAFLVYLLYSFQVVSEGKYKFCAKNSIFMRNI